jgi:hypothetical protein
VITANGTITGGTTFGNPSNQPAGTQYNGNGTVAYPNGTLTFANGTVNPGSATTSGQINANGTISYPNGTILANPAGKATETRYGNGTIGFPNGTMLHTNGTLD